LKSGSLNLLEPSEPVQACNGIALPFTYVSLMYELKKKIGKVFTSKFVGTGPSSFEKRIYRAAVSQRLRNTGLEDYYEQFI